MNANDYNRVVFLHGEKDKLHTEIANFKAHYYNGFEFSDGKSLFTITKQDVEMMIKIRERQLNIIDSELSLIGNK